MVKEFRPKIIGFFCNWCAYPCVDNAGASKLEMVADVAPIRVMCSGRIDPVLIGTAFLRGADGVLVTGCHPGDCHYEDRNFYGRRRFLLAKQVIEALGLESDRLKLAWISASEGRRFADVINEFTDKIQQLGPNPIKNNA